MLLFRWERSLFVCVLLSVLFVVSCGRKGNPTLVSFEKPPSVKEIKAIHREDEIVISWSYPADERQHVKVFYLEKAEGDGQPYKKIGLLKSESSRFVDKDFATGRQYFYKVRVVGPRDVVSDDSPVVRVSPKELPLPPSSLSYKITDGFVEISWNGATGEKQAGNVVYNIYKSHEKGKAPLSALNGAPLNGRFFREITEPEKTVYYTVRALLDTVTRDEGRPSAELEVGPGSFVPVRPSGLRYVPAEKSVYLLWNENPEVWVKAYRVYRRKSGEAAFTAIGNASVPAFKDNDALIGRTLYYITAIGPEKESVPSIAVEAGPLIEQ